MIALLLSLALQLAPPVQEAPLLTRAQMRTDLLQLAADVRANWSYFDDHSEHFGVELDAWVAAAIERLPAGASPDEFEDLLRPIVADLQDGHARLEVPGSSPAPDLSWPLTLVGVGEGLAVLRVADGLAPTLEGQRVPRPGDLLLTADGRAAAQLLEAARLESFGSTPGMRERSALGRMRQTAARAVAFEFERPDGSRFNVDLATVDLDAPGLAAPPEPGWILDELQPGLARLRIASFAMPDWKAWLAAEQPAREAMTAEQASKIDALFADLAARAPRALVLDLRDNGGGTDSLGIEFARHLLPGEFVYFKLSAFVDGKWTAPHGYTHGSEAELVRVVCPTVALIDAGCFSTTDNFLRALDLNHPDLTTVGRPTGGGTGAPRVVSTLTHSGASLTLCTQRVLGPDDQLTEGRGTLPDVAVTWSRVDLVRGVEPGREVALELLRERGLLER